MLRVSNRISQKEMAEMVGTNSIRYRRVENADYRGHSLTMLTRIAVKMTVEGQT